MKKLMLCRGVGTTALKGGVIPNLLHFFAQDSILERSPSSCNHMCCRLAKVFGCRQQFTRLL